MLKKGVLWLSKARTKPELHNVKELCQIGRYFLKKIINGLFSKIKSFDHVPLTRRQDLVLQKMTSYSYRIQGVTKRNGPPVHFASFRPFLQHLLKFLAPTKQSWSKVSSFVNGRRYIHNLLGGHFRIKDEDFHFM